MPSPAVPVGPAHIHGWPVIIARETRAAHATRPGRLVLVDASAKGRPEYVVSWQGLGQSGAWDAGWTGGLYTAKLSEALKVFAARVEREESYEASAEAALAG